MPTYQMTIDMMDAQQDRFVMFCHITKATINEAVDTAQFIANVIGLYTEAMPLLVTLTYHVDFERPQRPLAGSVRRCLKLVLESNSTQHYKSFIVRIPSPNLNMLTDDGTMFDATRPLSQSLIQNVLSKLTNIDGYQFTRVLKGIHEIT